MDRWSGKIAVVTGAAGGIGEAITVAFLKNGVNVVGLDIESEKLKIAAAKWKDAKLPGTLYPVYCDVRKDEDIEHAFSVVETTFKGVDILVNNAGVTNYTRIIESDRTAFEKLLNINVLAVASCTNRAVRSMRARNVEGHIFNINSVLGHEMPGDFPEVDGYDGWNLYPATKHATVALTHSVRRELAAIKAPIRITSISPGLVATDIAKHSPTAKEFFDKVPALRPEDVADGVIYALGTRPEVQITELTIRLRGEM